jgi:hypothetical protein
MRSWTPAQLGEVQYHFLQMHFRRINFFAYALTYTFSRYFCRILAASRPSPLLLNKCFFASISPTLSTSQLHQQERLNKVTHPTLKVFSCHLFLFSFFPLITPCSSLSQAQTSYQPSRHPSPQHRLYVWTAQLSSYNDAPQRSNLHSRRLHLYLTKKSKDNTTAAINLFR